MAACLFLLAASAAVLVSAQFPPPPNVSTGCTSKSFTIPSWFVQDLEIAADEGVLFRVSNRATNYTANLACPTEEGGWNGCSIQGGRFSNGTLEASVQVGEDSLSVLVSETWVCNDRGISVTFTATGNSSAALDYMSPLLVKGSLLEPVAITPDYAEGPTGHDTPGCTARSEEPSWVLSTIGYTDQTGDGVTTIPYKQFYLVITNQANGYQASCMAGAGFNPEDPDLSRLACAGYEFQSPRTGRYPITTTASFDEETLQFSVSQTWFCDDTDAAKPLQITATGSIELPLDCTTQTIEGNQTRKECATDRDVPVAGSLGEVVTLPPYALEEPLPRRDGCTLTSIFNPRWQFSAFRIYDDDNGDNGSSAGSVSFEVILQAQDRGFQYPIPIYQGAPVEGDDEGWYECDIGADGGNGLPLWPYECTFKYTRATNELVLDAKWACRDLDLDQPVYFSGITTTTIDSELSCETVDGRSRCTTADPGYSWSAEISDVTWGSSEE